MTDESADPGGPTVGATTAASLPAAVDRAAFQAELDRLRVLALTGPHGPLTLLDAFEGRRQLIAY
jgi:hypothetical protein